MATRRSDWREVHARDLLIAAQASRQTDGHASAEEVAVLDIGGERELRVAFIRRDHVAADRKTVPEAVSRALLDAHTRDDAAVAGDLLDRLDASLGLDRDLDAPILSGFVEAAPRRVDRRGIDRRSDRHVQASHNRRIVGPCALNRDGCEDAARAGRDEHVDVRACGCVIEHGLRFDTNVEKPLIPKPLLETSHSLGDDSRIVATAWRDSEVGRRYATRQRLCAAERHATDLPGVTLTNHNAHHR